MTNIFEIASLKKFRFASSRGDLTTEQLWDLPLTAKDGFCLDNVARAVNGDLKALAEESFVTTRANTGQTDLETKLEIVKHIIAFRIAQAESRAAAGARAEERRRILETIAAKENEELSSASKEELLKRLAELDG